MMKSAPTHHGTISGQLSLPRLIDLIQKKEGFVIQLDGTSLTLTLLFSWKDVISMREDFLFFVKPLNGALHYYCVSRRKISLHFVNQVFYDLLRETLSNHHASSKLVIVYQDRLLKIHSAQ